MPNRNFRAFLSYSQKDKEFGIWLHRSLERFSVPKSLIGQAGVDGPIPSRLSPIFRDRDELSASPNLPETLRSALEKSAYLIVLCSANSAASKWVNDEVTEFIRLGRRDRIIIAIHSENQVGAPENYFPAVLKSVTKNEGFEAVPLAVDFRKSGDGKVDGLLKVAAATLGISFDALKRRAESAKRRRLLGIAVAAVSSAILFMGIAGYAFIQAEIAARERNDAQISESKLLAKRAIDSIENGDAVAGANEALEGLPDFSLSDRPLVRELEFPLNRYLYERRELYVFSCSAVSLRKEMNFRERIVVPCSDKKVRIFNVRTGAVENTLQGHTDNVNDAAFSSDGKYIATASDDKFFRLYDAGTGRLIHASEASAPIGRVMFTADSKRVISAANDRMIFIWDLNGQILRSIKIPDESFSYPEIFEISRDGRYFVTASSLASAVKDPPRLWSIETSDQISQLSRSDRKLAPVVAAFFSNDGESVITTELQGAISQWDVRTGSLISSINAGAEAALSKDGSHIIAARRNQIVLAGLPLKEENVLSVYTLTSSPVRVSVGSDGSYLAVTRDNRILLGKIRSGVKLLSGHTAGIDAAMFVDNDRAVISSSLDGTVRVWSNSDIGSVSLPWDGISSPDGSRLVTYTNTNLTLIDSSNQTAIAIIDGDFRNGIQSAAFSPTGSALLLIERQGRMRIFNAFNGELKFELSGSMPFIIDRSRVGIFSLDGALVMTGGAENAATIWSVNTGKIILKLDHRAPIEFLRATKNRVVTLDTLGAATIWNFSSGDRLVEVGSKSDQVIDFDVDGPTERAIICFADRFEIWDLETPRMLGVVTSYPKDDMLGISYKFSPDSRTLAMIDEERIRLLRADGAVAPIEFNLSKTMSSMIEPNEFEAIYPARNRSKSEILKTINAWLHRGYFFTERTPYLSYSSDSSRIAFIEEVGKVRVVDTRLGKSVSLIDVDMLSSTICLTPNGDRLIVATGEKLFIYNVSDGSAAELGQVQDVQSIQFSRKGNMFVVTSSQGIGLWDVSSLRMLTEIKSPPSAFSLVEFFGDGDRIIATDDELLRVWASDGGILLARIPVSKGVRLKVNKQGTLFGVAAGQGETLVRRISLTLEELASRVKKSLPRCLTPSQRKELFASRSVPSWCSHGASQTSMQSGKWPYQN